MAGSVTAECHLWLNLTEIREKEKVFLLDAPISQSGLFGKAVNSVVEKFRSAKMQSAALKQFMPRRMRDHSTPSSSLSREQSLPRKEPSSRSGAQATHPLPTTLWGARGRPFPRQRSRRRLTRSGPADPPLRLLRVVPDPRVGMRRAASPLRGETRPQKRICPPQTRSPHSDLSRPPLEVWCAERVHPHFSSVWQLGDASSFPPLQAVPLPPAGHVLGDMVGSLLQRTDPVPAIFQSSTSLSIIPNKDAEGFPSWWMASLLPGLLDTPTQVCLPLHDTLLPLSRFILEWERLPGVSLWVLCTVRSGYTLQFGRNPPHFDGVQLTVVNSTSKASVLQQELSSLLQKGAVEEIPQSEIEQGFFSRYFLVPKRDGGLRPILDLRRLNFSREVQDADDENHHVSDSGGDWFITIDLKDAYFHIQVVQRHRKFLRFAFGGKAYQYKVLPFGLALAQRTFTKCMDAALAPLRLQGIRVLNYLDDWLILAHSRELVIRHRDIVFRHIHSLGLRMNAKKSVLFPSQRTVFLGVHLDSIQMQAHLAPAWISYSMSGLLQSRPSCLGRYLPQAARPHGSGLSCVAPKVASHEAVPLVDERAEVTPHDTSHSLIRVSRNCSQPLLQWQDPAFLQSGVRMGAIHRRHMITMDASSTGWVVVFEGSPANGE